MNSTQRDWLAGLGLYFNQPELAIICIQCGYAIKPDGDRVSRHLGEKHQTPKPLRKGLNTFIQSLHLPDPASLPRREHNCSPHPHLLLQKGFICKPCGFRSSSEDLIIRHLSSSHKDLRESGHQNGWVVKHIIQGCAFQSWQARDIIRSWQVCI